MRWLAALLLLLLTSLGVDAALLLRGGGTGACAFTGSTTVGSCINFANQGVLTTTEGSSWQFTGATTLSVTGAVTFNVSATQAKFCHVGGYHDGSIALQSPTNLAWWTQPGFGTWQQQPVTCQDSSSYFLVNGTPVISLFTACTTGTANATIEIKVNPSSYWFGFTPANGNDGGCTIGASGATFTLDSGATISTPYTANGAAGIEINAANVVFNGAGATICCQTFGQVNEMLDVVTNNAPNPTIQGASGNPFTIACNNGGQTGILTGPVPSGTSDTVTLTHLVIDNCGTDGGGNNHGIYIGWGTGSSGNTAYCEALSDIVIKNSGGDTNALKVDVTCGASQGSITNVSVYVTNAGWNVNEPIDFQCGGWHSVTKSYFEMYGQSAGNDQFAFSKLNWGALGASGCQSTEPPTQITVFDKITVVYDGPTNGTVNDGTGLHKTVACISKHDGNSCGATAGSIATCVKNSQIIDNSSDQTFLLTVGRGVAVDSGCTGSGADTNTYYRSATARQSLLCGVATNWPSDGHSCVFPYVPQYLTDNDTHETLVAAAHAAGLCGEGTVSDPIAACPVIDWRLALQ